MGARRQKGFTLVELITVVVILSLVAVIGTSFIVSATDSYQRTQSRALLANTGRQALERMTRQLRGALPYSLRITNGGACVQFMPVAGGGRYREPVPTRSDQPTHDSIATTEHRVDFGEAVYLSIGAMDDSELYGPGAAARTGIISRNPSEVTFANRRWPRNSLSQRFFLLNEPEAFCLLGDELRYYANQDANDTGVIFDDAHDLLALNVQAGEPLFELSSASENRNVVLAINIRFGEGGESLSFDQEVLLRNVP